MPPLLPDLTAVFLIAILCVLIARQTAPARSLSARIWIPLALLAPLPATLEAIHASLSAPIRTTVELRDGRIVAQAYREAYTSLVDGRTVEHPERWFLRIGPETPRTIETTIAPFPTIGADAAHIAFTGTPGSTIRASVAGLPSAPLQICTGSCDGLSEIPDPRLTGSDGIVLAHWRRVQGSMIGQPALGPRVVPVDGISTLSPGRWLLTAGAGALLTIASLRLAARLQSTPAMPVRRAEKPVTVRRPPVTGMPPHRSLEPSGGAAFDEPPAPDS